MSAGEGCGCALILLALGVVLGWSVFVHGVVAILRPAHGVP
jgi:hypothetical protein